MALATTTTFIITCSVLPSNNHLITLSDEWKAENLSVIAFVYNDSGVLQVTKTKLLNNEVVEE